MSNVQQICHLCSPSLLAQLGLPTSLLLGSRRNLLSQEILLLFHFGVYFPSCLVIPLRRASSFNAYLRVFRINKLDMLLNLSWPFWFPPAPRLPFGHCLSGGSLG